MIENHKSCLKIDKRFFFYLLQFYCFITGIAFSAGGGNFPEQSQNIFGVFKAVFLTFPVLYVGYWLLIKPKTVILQITVILNNNKYLFLYYFISLLLLTVSVNSAYAFTRWLYSFLGLTAAVAILVQYFFYGYGNNRVYLQRLFDAISGYILLLPLYVLVSNHFALSNFRFDLESLYLVHPNILAALYAHFILWHGIHFFYLKRKMNLCYFFIFCSMDFLLFSRAVIISLFIVLNLMPIICLYLFKNKNAFLIFIFQIMIYLVLFIFIMIDVINLVDIMSLITRNDTIDSVLTLTNRTVLWNELMSRLDLKIFFTGYGYSIIDTNYGIDLGTGILYGAHNAYLSVLLGSGFFALVAILIWLANKIVSILSRRINMQPQMTIILISSFFLFLMTSMFSEEIGVSFSITFAYLFFLTNITLYNGNRQ